MILYFLLYLKYICFKFIGAALSKGVAPRLIEMKKGKIIFGNAFSLQMLPMDMFSMDKDVQVKIREITEQEAKQLFDKHDVNAISHESTAQVLSELFNRDIKENRINITLTPADTLVVFQVFRRPSEGKVFSKAELDEIVSQGLYKFLIVTVHD